MTTVDLGIIVLVFKNVYSETNIQKVWLEEKCPECPMYLLCSFSGGGLYHLVLE